MSMIRLQVISLHGLFLDEMVDFFSFMGPMGRTGLLKGHAPLLTVLNAGRVVYQTQSTSKHFYTMGGIVEFQDNKAVLLADYCSLEEISVGPAKTVSLSKEMDSTIAPSKSFHQLYAELLRGPAEFAALKGLHRIRGQKKD